MENTNWIRDRKVIEWCQKSLKESRPVFWMDKLPKWKRVAINVISIFLIPPALFACWVVSQMIVYIIEQF